MIALRILAFAAGVFVVGGVLGSAVRTVVVPRGVPSRITRRTFRVMRAFFDLRAGPRATYERRDRILTHYAPVSLLVLILVWVLLTVGGFTAMFWATGAADLAGAFRLSGSSALTLGFDRPGTLPMAALSFAESAIGLLILALLISYLPTLYGIYSRREQFVAFMEVRADSPPAVDVMLRRLWAIGRPDERLGEIWERAEQWFAEIGETHTSQPALVFFRSPLPQSSWVTTAGAILDAAAIVSSTLDRPRDPDAELCIRSGYLALRHVAGYFRVPYDPDPAPDAPISIAREEYDAVVARLERIGIPLKADRDEAWRDYAGWRVNYDEALLGLALLVAAPPAPWSSDRPQARSALALTRPRRNG